MNDQKETSVPDHGDLLPSSKDISQLPMPIRLFLVVITFAGLAWSLTQFEAINVHLEQNRPVLSRQIDVVTTDANTPGVDRLSNERFDELTSVPLTNESIKEIGSKPLTDDQFAYVMAMDDTVATMTDKKKLLRAMSGHSLTDVQFNMLVTEHAKYVDDSPEPCRMGWVCGSWNEGYEDIMTSPEVKDQVADLKAVANSYNQAAQRYLLVLTPMVITVQIGAPLLSIIIFAKCCGALRLNRRA